MIKEIYEPIELEVIKFHTEDVISTSSSEEYEDKIISQGG